MPLSSAETRAVCLVPRKPRCSIAASVVCPSASGVRRRSVGEIWRNGFAGFASSHVNILPDAWPPAMVERSAEMLIEVTEPHSIAAHGLLVATEPLFLIRMTYPLCLDQ